MDFLRVVTVNITYEKYLNKTYVFKGTVMDQTPFPLCIYYIYLP